MRRQWGKARKPQERIEFLDVMRVVAIASVIVAHKFSGSFQFIDNPATHVALRTIGWLIWTFCEGGGAGVAVFFLTSGYIITHVLRSETSGEFLVRRAFRIYPLYLLAVVSEAACYNFVHGTPFPPWHTLLPRLLLIGDFTGTPLALAGVEWTLRLEILFYLAMAGVKRAGFLRQPFWLPTMLTSGAVLLWATAPFPRWGSWTDGYVSIYGHFLVVGCLLYLAQTRMVGWLPVLAAAAISLLLASSLITRFNPALEHSIAAEAALAVFVAGWALRHRIRAGAVLRTLSNLSYALYLFHNWLWGYLGRMLDSVSLQFLPRPLQILILLLGVCYLLHRLVEVPVIALGRRMASLESKRAAVGQDQLDTGEGQPSVART